MFQVSKVCGIFVSTKQNDMKKTQKFVLDTPIIDKYHKNKLLGYARIEGVGYSDQNYAEDWLNGECEPDSIFSFDIDTVYFLIDGVTTRETKAYKLCKALGDSLADIIDAAVLAHMVYIFSQEYAQELAMKPELEHTDINQD